MENQNIQLIGAEDHSPQQKINVVRKSGLVTDGSQSSGVKKPTAKWFQKMIDNSPTFDLQKQKETFLQAKRDFYNGVSCYLKANEKGKWMVRILL